MSHDTVSPGSPELSRGRRVLTLPSQTKVHPLVLTAFICGILALDFTTGPYVQIAILLVFPVAMATWSYGRRWGAAIAVVLPLLRLPFFFYFWQIPNSWMLEVLDTGTDILVLLALVWMVEYVARQRQEINVLEGMLPTCGFCKRIRDESGRWLQMEHYISQRSEARFSHTFCPECGQRHYGDLVT
jgi:hypothetical protein